MNSVSMAQSFLNLNLIWQSFILDLFVCTPSDDFTILYYPKQPHDWDEDEDGKWRPPRIPNPAYRGPWKPKVFPLAPEITERLRSYFMLASNWWNFFLSHRESRILIIKGNGRSLGLIILVKHIWLSFQYFYAIMSGFLSSNYSFICFSYWSEFEDDPDLYVLKPIKYVGIEVWQVGLHVLLLK